MLSFARLIIVTIIFNKLIKVECTSNMALSPSSYPVYKRDLHVPPLEEVAEVFRAYLPSNFADVEVEVVDSPELNREPFYLAAKGLSGNPKLLEVGGTQYLLPVADLEKLYDLKDIANLADVNPAFIIGAAAGPYPYSEVNCEGIINIRIENGVANHQQSRISKLVGNREEMVVNILPNHESRIALLGNLYASEGKPGKVIRVHAKKRIGKKDFIATLRNSIEKKYGQKHLVGIGGAFLIAEGKVRQHVMRNFSKTPLQNDEDVNNWLKFFEMSAPLTAVGTFTSNDGGDLDLRVQHFHSFSMHGEAGHYHNDTTPDTVEYLGFFNVAHEIVRIDQPESDHKYGRD